MKTCGSCFRYCEDWRDAQTKGLKPVIYHSVDEYFRKPRLGVKPRALGIGCPRNAELSYDHPACKSHKYRWMRNFEIWWQLRFKPSIEIWFRKHIRVPLGGLRKPLSLIWNPYFDGMADCVIPNGEPCCPYCGEMPYSHTQCVFCGQRFLTDEFTLKRDEPPVPEGEEEFIGFIDGICPECGRSCGNSGHGPLRCSCGWIGGALSKEAQKAIDELFAEEFGDREQPDAEVSDV